MNIATLLEELQTSRNKLRAKFVELGLVESSAKYEDIATAAEGIENRGAVSAQVQEGNTYTIPKGYHNGSGTVSGVAGGGNYTLQSKTVTPTKAQQNVTPDSGFYGMSDVTVAAIPEIYQDVSSVNAGAGDVLANKVIVDATGKVTTGTMHNNGAIDKTIDVEAPSYTVPQGYHSGAGVVKIVTEDKEVTPTKVAQEVTPTTGKVIKKVTVAPIPEDYIDTTDADAIAANILVDKTAYVNGVKVTGTMPNNGSPNVTIDGITVTSLNVTEGYYGGGTVSLTDDIERALAAL